MKEKLIGAALLAVGTVIGAGLGWVGANVLKGKETSKLRKELEESHKDLASVLKTFEIHSTRMESIIQQVASNPPKDKPDLRKILRENGLSQIQTEQIVGTIFPGLRMGARA